MCGDGQGDTLVSNIDDRQRQKRRAGQQAHPAKRAITICTKATAWLSAPADQADRAQHGETCSQQSSENPCGHPQMWRSDA
jgi:hypothetical protein